MPLPAKSGAEFGSLASFWCPAERSACGRVIAVQTALDISAVHFEKRQRKFPPAKQ